MSPKPSLVQSKPVWLFQPLLMSLGLQAPPLGMLLTFILLIYLYYPRKPQTSHITLNVVSGAKFLPLIRLHSCPCSPGSCWPSLSPRHTTACCLQPSELPGPFLQSCSLISPSPACIRVQDSSFPGAGLGKWPH